MLMAKSSKMQNNNNAWRERLAAAARAWRVWRLKRNKRPWRK